MADGSVSVNSSGLDVLWVGIVVAVIVLLVLAVRAAVRRHHAQRIDAIEKLVDARMKFLIDEQPAPAAADGGSKAG